MKWKETVDRVEKEKKLELERRQLEHQKEIEEIRKGYTVEIDYLQVQIERLKSDQLLGPAGEQV